MKKREHAELGIFGFGDQIGLLHGDFGTSISLHQDVLHLVLERLPATLELAFTALLLFLPVVIVLIAENAGHVKAVSEMTGADLDKDLGRAFMGDGAATTLAGAATTRGHR